MATVTHVPKLQQAQQDPQTKPGQGKDEQEDGLEDVDVGGGGPV